MRFELLVDSVLDDGRLVVVNNSAEGFLPGPEQSALILAGAFDVPLGVEFTKVMSRRSIRLNGEYAEEQIGSAEGVSLQLHDIEWFRKKTKSVPSGHNAAVRFEGKGLELIRERLDKKPRDIHVYLSTDNSET